MIVILFVPKKVISNLEQMIFFLFQILYIERVA